jgi:hypothetical protein
VPYNKQQKTDWQRKQRKKMRDAGYKFGWIPKSSYPKYGTTVKRIKMKKLRRKKK